jgi:hypothetical protein
MADPAIAMPAVPTESATVRPVPSSIFQWCTKVAAKEEEKNTKTHAKNPIHKLKRLLTI